MVVLVIRAEEEDATRKENLRLRPYKRQQQRSEKMRFYHAAPKETMMKIYAEGVLKKSWDGVVYMCKDPIDACKFLVIRGMRQMSVIELELDEKEVEESHDHSETFFKCKEQIFLIFNIGTICLDVQKPKTSCNASVSSVLVLMG